MDVHEDAFNGLAIGGFQDSAWDRAGAVTRWDVEVFGCVKVYSLWERCLSCSSHLTVLRRSDLDVVQALS